MNQDSKKPKQKRRVYTEEEIAAVVSMLISGQSQKYIEEETGIPQSTIAGWNKRYIVDGESILPNQRTLTGVGNRWESAPTLIDIQELILVNLQKELEVKNAILERVLNDADWVAEQSAQDLAILYGVISDKNDRTLQRITEANSPNNV